MGTPKSNAGGRITPRSPRCVRCASSRPLDQVASHAPRARPSTPRPSEPRATPCSCPAGAPTEARPAKTCPATTAIEAASTASATRDAAVTGDRADRMHARCRELHRHQRGERRHHVIEDRVDGATRCPCADARPRRSSGTYRCATSMRPRSHRWFWLVACSRVWASRPAPPRRACTSRGGHREAARSGAQHPRRDGRSSDDRRRATE